MADLYASIGQNARKVLTTSDVTGPETTWIVINDTGAGRFEDGSDDNPALTTANSFNQKVVNAIAQWCEIYEVVRPSTVVMAIKVRASSVPYDDDDARNDAGENTILQTAVRAATDSDVDVYNGQFRDDDINWD